ncbi:MAG TPA: aldehyde dehydrogenase [Bacteroidia bacterium]|nr:aldehyde dehydrogenase [Bacteroidia bacterium]HNT80044.1 aldehyde dehydrogenase [Bacteroidia bacterium]
MQSILNYINGKLVEPISSKRFDGINPATAKVLCSIPDSDALDVEQAVNAAKIAFPKWSTMSAQKRSSFLLKIADLIDESLDQLAKAESEDNGKPIWLAKQVDIPRASANFRFYATASLHFASEAHPMDSGALNYTLHQPIGIAGCISPWNLPLYLFTWKIAPALAAGNCVVAKPSEITPLTAFLLSQLCIKAGLPDGVLNIVHGYGPSVGSAICSHPEIPIISFTGGTKTGAEISRIAAPMFKKLSLELGGKNPNIIFDDCDFDHAVSTSVKSSFSNQGEICLCGSRIFVHQNIYDRFKESFIEEVKALKTGDPELEENFLGAIVSKPHFEKVLSYIELAKQEGGKILTGGSAIRPEGRCKEGYFIEPTVFENLPFNCRTNQEEIFGPVVTLIPFADEEEVIKMANSTPYGLSATIWTKDLNKAHKTAASLHSGIVWINCWLLRDLRTPFGGVKQSGVGREGGFEALKFFTDEKNVCIKL